MQGAQENLLGHCGWLEKCQTAAQWWRLQIKGQKSTGVFNEIRFAASVIDAEAEELVGTDHKRKMADRITEYTRLRDD